MPKRILEAMTPGGRAEKRQRLGPLRGLTVQPSTRKRYDRAIDDFLKFLKVNQLSLPKQREKLDPLVGDFLEHLWSSGQGRALGSDCVAGLQDMDPKLRGQLPGSWRLLKTWAINEIPNRAPPLPEHVLHAMCGWAVLKQHYGFAVSLLLGFYGMLRTGELLEVRRKDLMGDSSFRKIVLSLGLTKGGKRTGTAESIVLGHDVLTRPLGHWMKMTSGMQKLSYSPAKWRSLFQEALVSLKLQSFEFRPYSLRRGGATWWFGKHQSLDAILVQGRWQAAKTARLYINEGLAILAEPKLAPSDSRLKSFISLFRAQLISPTFATIEPPPKVGSKGGRGRGRFSSRSSMKNLFCGKFFLGSFGTLYWIRGLALPKRVAPS